MVIKLGMYAKTKNTLFHLYSCYNQKEVSKKLITYSLNIAKISAESSR